MSMILDTDDIGVDTLHVERSSDSFSIRVRSTVPDSGKDVHFYEPLPNSKGNPTVELSCRWLIWMESVLKQPEIALRLNQYRADATKIDEELRQERKKEPIIQAEAERLSRMLQQYALQDLQDGGEHDVKTIEKIMRRLSELGG